MYLFPVEHYYTSNNILVAFFVDFGLEGHFRERDTVDGQKEGIFERGIIQDNLPVELIVLELDWKQTRLSVFFAIKFV